MSDKTLQSRSVLGEMQPSKAIVKLAVPATLALLAKAAYNIVDTAYIGMLNSDIALTAVGVTVPLLLTVLVAAVYIILSRPLIMLFNRNPVIGYGSRLLISQTALYPAFGMCYMMTITFQTIGSSRYGLFLSMIRQGLFYVPFILVLPRLIGVAGIYLSQPMADILTILVCLLSIRPMKSIASRNMMQ